MNLSKLDSLIVLDGNYATVTDAVFDSGSWNHAFPSENVEFLKTVFKGISLDGSENGRGSFAMKLSEFDRVSAKNVKWGIFISYASSFLGVDFSGASFAHVGLTGSDWARVMAKGAAFESFMMADSHVEDCTFSDSTFRQARFENSIVKNSVWQGCDLGKAQFYQSTVEGTGFDDCVLTQTTFGSVLQNVTFQGGDARDSRWEKAILNSAFSGVDLRGARFEDLKIEGTVFAACNLADAKFLNCDLSGANFAKAGLASVRRAGFIGCTGMESAIWPKGFEFKEFVPPQRWRHD